MKRASLTSKLCLASTCTLFAIQTLMGRHVLLVLHTYLCACLCGYVVAAQMGALNNR